MASLRSGKTIDEEMLEETLGDEESEEVATGHTVNIHNHMTPGDKEMAKEDDDKDDKTVDRIAKRFADAMAPAFAAIDAQFKTMKDELEDLKKEKAKEKEDEKEETKDNEKILGQLELEAPPGTNDRASFAKKVKDCSFLDHSFRETVALAEVLAPGIRVPTLDRAASPASGLDTICNLRRTALDHACANDIAVRQLVDAMGAGGYKTMDCGAIKPAFVAAAEFKKRANNGSQSGRTVDAGRPGPGGSVGGTRKTIADVNKRNSEFYAPKRA